MGPQLQSAHGIVKDADTFQGQSEIVGIIPRAQGLLRQERHCINKL